MKTNWFAMKKKIYPFSHGWNQSNRFVRADLSTQIMPIRDRIWVELWNRFSSL